MSENESAGSQVDEQGRRQHLLDLLGPDAKPRAAGSSGVLLRIALQLADRQVPGRNDGHIRVDRCLAAEDHRGSDPLGNGDPTSDRQRVPRELAASPRVGLLRHVKNRPIKQLRLAGWKLPIARDGDVEHHAQGQRKCG